MNDAMTYHRLHSQGFELVGGLLSSAECQLWLAELAVFLARGRGTVLSTGGAIYGARDLLRDWPELVLLIGRTSTPKLISEILGPGAGLVRALYFDKPPERTWSLPWHRDTAIAVRDHSLRSDHFQRPTLKHGVPHVEAPMCLLESMLTVRIHLDAATPTNGALQVQAGSHVGESRGPVVGIYCEAGDALLMRPLLLHASGESQPGTTEHRRVLHFEFAPSEALPDGYAWRDFISF
ncbi:MAG: phytanoyl-CoA dioxygenase family protein [Fimbriiglobus sp.]